MSFWKRLFGSQAPDKMEFVAAMVEMAIEAERTYRGMLVLYNEEIAPPYVSPATPTDRGLYKARLFGALFMAMAYARTGQSREEAEEMVNAATGLALEPLQGHADPRLSREEVLSFAAAHLISLLKCMTAAFNAGPCEPWAPKPEHFALAEHLHDALAESIGKGRYTSEVRDRFSVAVMGNVALAMNHAGRWMA